MKYLFSICPPCPEITNEEEKFATNGISIASKIFYNPYSSVSRLGY